MSEASKKQNFKKKSWKLVYEKMNFQFWKKISTPLNVSCLFTFSAVCLLLSAVCLLLSAVLFTISAICLQFQLFVYNFSCLFTFFVSCLFTFVSCLFTFWKLLPEMLYSYSDIRKLKWFEFPRKNSDETFLCDFQTLCFLRNGALLWQVFQIARENNQSVNRQNPHRFRNTKQRL